MATEIRKYRNKLNHALLIVFIGLTPSLYAQSIFIPDTIAVIDSSFKLPIYVSDIPYDLRVSAVDITLRYHKSVIDINSSGSEYDKIGTKMELFSIAVNEHHGDSTIAIGGASNAQSDSRIVFGSGTLLYLELTVKSGVSPGASTSITFDAFNLQGTGGRFSGSVIPGSVTIVDRRSKTFASLSDTAVFSFQSGATTDLEFESGATAGQTVTVDYYAQTVPADISEIPNTLFYQTIESPLSPGSFSASMTMHYPDSLSPGGINEQHLLVVRHDAAQGRWVSVEAERNTAANTLTFSTDRFSAWAIVDSASFMGLNAAPVLSAIGNLNVSEGEMLTIVLQSSDADNDPLTFSISNAPSGSDFSGSTFSWTPASNQAGTYQVTFSVTDGVATDSETITITVLNVNQPPEILNSYLPNAKEGLAYSRTITVSDGDAGDSHIFVLLEAPSWLSISGSGVLSGTPNASDVGTDITISIRVTDSGGLSDTFTTTINVLAATVNNPPTATLTQNQTTGTLSTLFLFDASGCSDLEDAKENLLVRWDWESDGTWDMEFTSSKTATHQFESTGTYTVTVEVKDSEGATASATTTITVVQPETVVQVGGGRIDVSTIPSLDDLELDNLYIDVPSGAVTGDMNLQIDIPTDIPETNQPLQAVEFTVDDLDRFDFQDTVTIGIPYPDTIPGSTPLTIAEWKRDSLHWIPIDLPESISIDTVLKIVTARVTHFSVYGVLESDEQIVPVELAYLTYEYTMEQHVQLHWSTLSETNNLGFSIERSVDGQSYAAIGFVEGQGTSDTAVLYSFTDRESIDGNRYYRLKQIDFDGWYTYSDLLKISVPVPERFRLLQNYPNPFNPVTRIHYELSEPGHVTLQIFNVSGEVITTLINEQQQAGIYTVTWDAADRSGQTLSSGIYFYRLESNGRQQARKLIYLK